jgi:predicted dehydrogenase
MRVAFAGLGFAARELHLPAVRSIDEIDIAGGADPSDDCRNAWADAGGGAVFEDVDELITRTAPTRIAR